MMFGRFLKAFGVVATLVAAVFVIRLHAQSCGPDGAFLANGNYTVCGLWTFTQQPVFPGGGGSPVTLNGTQTLTNKTLTAPTVTSPTITGTTSIGNGATLTTPVLSGSVTGTYTLAGTPTITAPAISAPVFSGSATGTYTLAGTPTITAPAISAPVFSGSATGTYTLAGTPTITAPAISAPVLSGTATGTYTLGGTPTITAPTIATITNTGTLTLPNATGGVPVMFSCGSTGSGNQTCAPAAATAVTKIYVGHSTLSANAAVITFPTAFAATTSYECLANDVTTRANVVQMVSTSTTTATITNTTGMTDVISWMCIGQ